MILLNGPPGVGKSTIGRRLRDDRPLSLLVDFDELWLLIGDWQHRDTSQQLAVDAGLAMARAHLRAGHDVIATQFSVDLDFFETIDTLVAETAASCLEIVLTGRPDRVASQFRERRAARMAAGESDVSANIPEERVDEVIAGAITGLREVAAARPRTMVVSADGDVASTHRRVREAILEQRSGGVDRAAVERLLRRGFGDDARIADVRRIRPWTVARCDVDGGRRPGTVIVKWLRSNPEGVRVDRSQIAVEAAALRWLERAAPGVAPSLLAQDLERDLLVLEDLAPRRTLHSVLAGGLTPRGVAGLHTFASTMGTMHAMTASETYAGPVDPAARVPISERAAADLLDRLAPLARSSRHVRRATSLAVRAMEDPGPFDASSNGDSGANNCLVDPEGADGRLIDFEHFCRRHVLLDVAALHVPGSMWMTVADPMPLGIDDTYRRVAGARIPAVLDDHAYGQALAAACALRALSKLQRIDKLDGRPLGHHSRRQLVATIDRTVKTLDHWGHLLAVAEWLTEVEAALRIRWPDADVVVPDDYTLREPFAPDH